MTDMKAQEMHRSFQEQRQHQICKGINGKDCCMFHQKCTALINLRSTWQIPSE